LKQLGTKYFFLSEGWIVARVWGADGLWNATAWRRNPQIDRLNLHIVVRGEALWLHRVEESIFTIEVKPIVADSTATSPIGQVVLKRLMTAEQVLERLCNASAACQLADSPVGEWNR
jgi:hypothetical protein